MARDEPFVGRVHELACLRDWLAEVGATGVGRFVLITGEAGAGKTRLCAEFDRSLADVGVAAAWSRCWDAGGGPPLWPWPDLIRELSDRAAPHPPVSPIATAGDRFGQFQAVLDDLRACCARGPVVILLDDLHVANHDVVLLTRFIARSLHRFPLLLVATWRLERASADDDSIRRVEAVAREASQLELPPFAEEELAQYLARRGRDDLSPAERARLLVLSGGNPMLVAELVRQRSTDRGRAGDRGLAAVIERRVAGLDDRARAILGAAAVLGDGTQASDVATILARPPEDVVAAANVSAGAAEIVDGRVRFSHELLRGAFEVALPVAERLALHLEAMNAVTGAEPDQVAWRALHAVEAASISDTHRPRAIAACAEAAGVLQRQLALEQAVEWAATGARLALGHSSPGVETELLLIHGGAVLAAGRLAEAHGLFSRAADTAERTQSPQLLAAAAIGLGGVWLAEQRDELSRRRLLSLCRRALAELPPDEPVLAGRVAVRLAAELADEGRPVDDVLVQVDNVRQLGDAAATAEALSVLHATLLGPEHAAKRLEIADELLDAAVSAAGTIYPLFGLCWKTIDLYLLGSPQADRTFVELRDRADALGCQSIAYIVSVLDVMQAIRRGDLEPAEHLAASALALGQAAGDVDALPFYGGQLLAIRWLQGRLDEMRDLITSVMVSSTLRGNDVSYQAVLGLVCALQGDERAARAAVEAAVADGLDSIGIPGNRMTTWAILVEAAAVLNDAALAANLAATLSPFAALPVMPSVAVACLGPAERAMGVACATAGRRDEAIGWFRAALDTNRRLENGPVDAIIRAQLADLLRHGSTVERAEAECLYTTAIQLGTSFGMVHWVSAWTASAASLDAPPAVRARQAVLEESPSAWRIDVDGRSTTVDRLVGLRYIASLLVRPDTDISAVELAAADGELPAVSMGAGVPTIDERARHDYERRIRELDRELDAADATGDVERGRRAADERTFLVDHLRRESGLGGRPRRMSDDAERCRMRVSKAIHRAIQRVSQADPVLGHMLATRVHTGHVCRYVTDPGEPIVWTVRTLAATAPA